MKSCISVCYIGYIPIEPCDTFDLQVGFSDLHMFYKISLQIT